MPCLAQFGEQAVISEDHLLYYIIALRFEAGWDCSNACDLTKWLLEEAFPMGHWLDKYCQNRLAVSWKASIMCARNHHDMHDLKATTFQTDVLLLSLHHQWLLSAGSILLFCFKEPRW